MTALKRAAALALLFATTGCQPSAQEQVLHVRLQVTSHRASGTYESGVTLLPGQSPQGSETGATFTLAGEVPVRASRPGEPFVLTPSATRPPTFGGHGRLIDKTDTTTPSLRVRTDMAATWADGTPATAPGAALSAIVASAFGNQIEAEVDADLRLDGRSDDGDGHGWLTSAASRWPDCTLSTTQIRCTIRLHLLTARAKPAEGPAGLGAGSEPASGWQRDIDGMQVRWTSQGHLVAHADSDDVPLQAAATTIDEIHVVLWTSAPGDTEEPEEARHAATIVR